MSVKDEVKKELMGSRGEYISGEYLSEKFGVSRAAVWKAVNALREEGLTIEASTNRGYIMPQSENAISEKTLKAALKARGQEDGAGDVYFFSSTDSTNLQAKKLVLDRRAEHGSLVFANQQTAGRGRLGRAFHSPENGIYMSIIVKPDFDLSRSGMVTVSAAAAVAQALEKVCRIDAQIKWVNDVYVEDRKVCGILTEAITDFETGTIDALIIGIGMNTDTAGLPDKIKEIAGAVSLENVKTKAALVAEIHEGVLENLTQIGRRSPRFMKIYRNKSMLLGHDITVYKGKYREDPTVEIGGTKAKAIAIDDEGGLCVRYKNGREEILTTGEVSIRV